FAHVSLLDVYTLSLHDALPIYNGDRAHGYSSLSADKVLLLSPPPKNSRTKAITRARTPTAKCGMVEKPRVLALVIAFVLLFFGRSEEHTSELQSRFDLVCRLLL